MGESRPEPDAAPELHEILEEARRLGLLGPGPVAGQLQHAVELARAIGPFDGRFLDLGSGGGLPGLGLAVEFPSATGCLLDSQQRRCAFLGQAIERLHLTRRLTVACGRAEALARDPSLRHQFDLVVARSFGPPPVTAECAAGFVCVGGRLVVTEPPGDEASATRWPSDGLAVLGYGPAERVRNGETAAVCMTRLDEADDRYPRRVGRPAKRPLW